MMLTRILILLLAQMYFPSCPSGLPDPGLPVARTVALRSGEISNDHKAARRQVLQSPDGGETWVDITEGLPADVRPTAVLARNGEILLGTDSGLYRNKAARPLAPVWVREHLLDLLEPAQVLSILPGTDGPVIRTRPGGFFHNLNGTGLWQPLYPEFRHQPVHAVLTRANGSALVASDDGIWRSGHGPGLWGHVFVQGMATSLVETESVVLASGELGVLRSEDGGDHWSWVLTGDGWCRKVLRIDDAVYAISLGRPKEKGTHPDSGRARLRRSTDGGLTWSLLDPGRTLGPKIYDLSGTGDRLFATTDLGLFRSSDGGSTWTLIREATSDQVLPTAAVDGPWLIVVEVDAGC